LPPLLDRLAYVIADDRKVGDANAVAEALVTIRDLAKSGHTRERDLRLSPETRSLLDEALGEWELLRAEVAVKPELLVELDREAAGLREAADSMVKATVHEPVGKPGGPGLWKHKGMQLPAYIQHIANDLREKRGMTTSRAIATAIAAVKRWAAGGGKVDPTTRAAATKAVAEWEALKARAHASSGAKKAVRATEANVALVRSADRLQHIVSEAIGQAQLGRRFANRVTIGEGILVGLGSRHPELALRTAREFLGEDAFDVDLDYSDPELVALAQEASVDLSAEGRKKLAAKGHAMPHGGYPIPNVSFLKKAIQAFGRSANPAATKAWIIKRAKALGATGMLPDGWDVKESVAAAQEMVAAQVEVERRLAEALGYARTPIRGKEKGHRGKFHGMHGVEKAVRRRSLIPVEEEQPPEQPTEEAPEPPEPVLAEAIPFTEELHPRAAHGPSGGQFTAGQGGQQPAPGAQQPQGGQPPPQQAPQPQPQAAPQAPAQAPGQAPAAAQPPSPQAVQQQLTDRLSELGYSDQSGGTGNGALKQFQQANGLASTGQLDPHTVAALQGADPADQAQKMIKTSLQFGASRRRRACSRRATSSSRWATRRLRRGSPVPEGLRNGGDREDGRPHDGDDRERI
jgi:hypothetical protein